LQIAHLKDDIIVPDYCALGESKNVEINAWFGPSNTVSPTHYDPKHNLLAQVFGTKLVRLYPSSESELLQPFPPESILFNTSQLDLEDPLLFEKHDSFKHAKYCEFLLPPGTMLYMPPKWWHFVKSLSPSFSVSFWFE
jgi:ribosomal protein L16 Arg81 hydroxylase